MHYAVGDLWVIWIVCNIGIRIYLDYNENIVLQITRIMEQA